MDNNGKLKKIYVSDIQWRNPYWRLYDKEGIFVGTMRYESTFAMAYKIFSDNSIDQPELLHFRFYYGKNLDISEDKKSLVLKNHLSKNGFVDLIIPKEVIEETLIIRKMW